MSSFSISKAFLSIFFWKNNLSYSFLVKRLISPKIQFECCCSQILQVYSLQQRASYGQFLLLQNLSIRLPESHLIFNAFMVCYPKSASIYSSLGIIILIINNEFKIKGVTIRIKLEWLSINKVFKK